jgi:hypothetical protein
MEYRPMTMVGELSEDGQWVWNGSEWDPYTEFPQETVQTKETSDNLVNLFSSTKPPLKEKRVLFALSAVLILVLDFIIELNAVRKMSQWCKEFAPVSGIYDTYDGAPYYGYCYVDGWNDEFTRAEWVEVGFDFFGYLCLILLTCGLLLHYAFRMGKQWNCGGCHKGFEAQDLKGSSELIVKSTSASTKQITSANPQFGIGMLGGNKGALMTIGSTTSNVPTVLGRISATYQCKSIECSKINTWLFDTEVQVWSNAETGEASYDITGEIVLP